MCFFMLRGFWFQDDSYSKRCKALHQYMSRRVSSRNSHQQKLNGKLESMCGPQEKFKISGVHLAVTAFQYRLFTVFQGSREDSYCDPDIWLLWADCSGPEVLGVSGSYIWFCQEDQRLHLYKVYARFFACIFGFFQPMLFMWDCCAFSFSVLGYTTANLTRRILNITQLNRADAEKNLGCPKDPNNKLFPKDCAKVFAIHIGQIPEDSGVSGVSEVAQAQICQCGTLSRSSWLSRNSSWLCPRTPISCIDIYIYSRKIKHTYTRTKDFYFSICKYIYI